MARIIEDGKENLVGGNVRKWRRKRKLTQMQLSAKLECMGIYVCRGSISRIENRTRTVTDVELVGICKVLGISIDDLFKGIDMSIFY